MKKAYIAWFSVFILFINVFVYIRFVQYPQSRQVIIAQELRTISEPLSTDSAVELTLTGTGDTLTSLSVFFSTYGRENQGEISVEIFDGEKLVGQKTVDMNDLKDNASYDFTDLNVMLKKRETYRVRLTSVPMEGGVSVWFDDNGTLVSSCRQIHRITVLEWISVNVTYSILWLVILKMRFWLKKEG